jgi:hypothetical protein
MRATLSYSVVVKNPKLEKQVYDDGANTCSELICGDFGNFPEIAYADA